MSEKKMLRILVAEDDEDDYVLTKEALSETAYDSILERVHDGEELLEYLRATVPVQAISGFQLTEGTERLRPHPNLILLDLNMPRKDGREALAEIKSDPDLRRIPVVVLTTSDAEEDIVRTYDLGVNSFIQKPVSFNEFIQTVGRLTDYWFQVVRLPS